MKQGQGIEPVIDVIIPALNEGKNIKACLEAVFRQEYPKEKLVATVVDGGSSDDTVAIAKQFGCRILHNEARLAEPGVAKGISESKADICCVLAVDNIIANKRDFFRKLIKPFLERNVTGAFPVVVYDKGEPLINKYITARAEPFSEFIYQNACNSRTFSRVYPIIHEEEDYKVFDFSKNDAPLLALAQGFCVDKKKFIRTAANTDDDLIPILEIIKRREEIAYVEKAQIYHLQIMNSGMFVRKFRWRIRRNLASNAFARKTEFFSRKMRMRKQLWPVYAISFVGPLIYSLGWCLKTKKIFYIYHFACTMILLFLIIAEYLRWTIHRMQGNKTIGTYK